MTIRTSGGEEVQEPVGREDGHAAGSVCPDSERAAPRRRRGEGWRSALPECHPVQIN